MRGGAAPVALPWIFELTPFYLSVPKPYGIATGLRPRNDVCFFETEEIT